MSKLDIVNVFSLLLDRRHCDVCATGFKEGLEREDHCKKKGKRKKAKNIQKVLGRWPQSVGHKLISGNLRNCSVKCTTAKSEQNEHQFLFFGSKCLFEIVFFNINFLFV